MKEKNDNELKLIKDFITKINNGTINNKYKVGNEFRKLKQKVTNDILRQDLIKYLEKYLFGEDIESKEKYEEEIHRELLLHQAHQKKTAETDEYLKYMEEQEKDRKKFSDEYDSNRWSSGSGLKILTNKQMLNRLPILLAQIPAGNNSIKLKNEIRQILYSLYRLKILTKTVYNNFVKSIRA